MTRPPTQFLYTRPCKNCGDVRRYRKGDATGRCPTCQSREEREKRAARPLHPRYARVAAELELTRQGVSVAEAVAIIAERMGPLPPPKRRPRCASPKPS